MTLPQGPAWITLFAIALLFACAAYVAYARGKYGVKAPATTGHPQFEVAYRVHMNTLENTVAFLPALWLCAVALNTSWATALGAVWLAARVWYALAYVHDPRRRGSGFTLALIATIALAVGAGFGLLRALL
jgi:uncharacterized membrane protein YecN with MAPEG domain